MLLKNTSALIGKELRYVESTNIKIVRGRFGRIGSNIHASSSETSIDCEGLLIVPGMINAHTHIGDSIGKDIALGASVDSKVHPVYGIKSKILAESNPKHLVAFMRASCKSMIKNGITTFVDFREDGLAGINLLRDAVSDVPIRTIILGRLNLYQNRQQIRQNHTRAREYVQELAELLKKCDGVGISGANEHSNATLQMYSKMPKIRAIHCMETRDSVRVSREITGRSEIIRALALRPDFLVHMTQASRTDLRLAAKKTRGIVVCPRANATLMEGLPDVYAMSQAGCNVAIGTDNVMINSPDIFREMDYLWKATMASRRMHMEPRHILKMATVNAGKILKRAIGSIESERLADCILMEKHSIDLEPMHDPYAALVHRASNSSIRAVMVGGKIAYGKI
ncbi:MAG: cytosine deaminase [Cenarchaeum symbiont of Oopsacas minuta]|nr:cytosine deaminase [Cenarchaeum symbiont of Oopsacas minuta]